jgi:catechol 2,3-dioxygenase-like lactoylglutathione lyase family enzyme
VQLDHLILAVTDSDQSISFYTEIMGMSHEGGGEHLAFALPKPDFDAIFDRVRDAGLEYGDSFHSVGNMRGPGDELGSRGDGKALYFFDPSKHLIEIRHYES